MPGRFDCEVPVGNGGEEAEPQQRQQRRPSALQSGEGRQIIEKIPIKFLKKIILYIFNNFLKIAQERNFIEEFFFYSFVV